MKIKGTQRVSLQTKLQGLNEKPPLRSLNQGQVHCRAHDRPFIQLQLRNTTGPAQVSQDSLHGLDKDSAHNSTCHFLNIIDPLVLHGLKMFVSGLVSGIPE